ncbi:LysR family transcriptional regulator [Endozoicomonas atrinae]|uniref:LysR family transcriptional regulator n=1 Tax=Endozoicomonas atrinae TaxID=1333660 RepID=UPI003AFFA280
MSKVTLDQWRMLQAVVEHGGFAQASKAIFKSQSTISYAISKLQHQLGIDLLEIQGRKAVLTEAGEAMLRRAQTLLKEADALEKVAVSLSEGWEGTLTLAADVIFPNSLLIKALELFAPVSRHTRLELVESVLSGTTDMLVSGKADIVITGIIPQGFLGEPLISINFVPVVHMNHPLAQLNHLISEAELKQYRQIVIRDSGIRRDANAGWLGSEERWTVSHISSSIRLVKQGLGFAWLPTHHIQQELEDGTIKQLETKLSNSRSVQLYMIFPDSNYIGPAAQKLATILRECCHDKGRQN